MKTITYKSINTLQHDLNSLSVGQLKALSVTLVDAGLCHEYKANTKAIFKKLRANAKGRVKRIYAALAKAKKREYELVFSALVGN